MKSLPGLGVSRSSAIRERASYEEVALEYYDELRHPTCADFREASRVYLKRILELELPSGQLADIGCGQSLISEFISENLILVDESGAMLNLNIAASEKRRINIIEASFGRAEFDWIYAVLADPYNEIGAWINIKRALKVGGRCVFITPSYSWASKFRASSQSEIAGNARFDLASGKSLFLPSTILSIEQQKELISSAGLRVDHIDHIYADDLVKIRSSKISSVLKGGEALLDIYRVCQI